MTLVMTNDYIQEISSNDCICIHAPILLTSLDGRIQYVSELNSGSGWRSSSADGCRDADVATATLTQQPWRWSDSNTAQLRLQWLQAWTAPLIGRAAAAWSGSEVTMKRGVSFRAAGQQRCELQQEPLVGWSHDLGCAYWPRRMRRSYQLPLAANFEWENDGARLGLSLCATANRLISWHRFPNLN